MNKRVDIEHNRVFHVDTLEKLIHMVHKINGLKCIHPVWVLIIMSYIHYYI